MLRLFGRRADLAPVRDGGRQVATVEADGNTNNQDYDANGHLVAEHHADGGTVTYDYDAFGDKVRATDAKSNGTDYQYDQLGRLTQVTHAAVDRYSVDANNQLQPLGNQRLVLSAKPPHGCRAREATFWQPAALNPAAGCAAR